MRKGLTQFFIICRAWLSPESVALSFFKFSTSSVDAVKTSSSLSAAVDIYALIKTSSIEIAEFFAVRGQTARAVFCVPRCLRICKN